MTVKDPDKPNKYGRKRKNKDISQKNELQDKAYKCETCGKSYMIFNLLQDHISFVHERNKGENGEISANKQQKRYECDICGKSYMQYTCLKKHIGVVHEGKSSTLYTGGKRQFLKMKNP
jgi:transcription elongation factor Elf1